MAKSGKRKPVSVPPCPTCGGPREPQDSDRLCENCRSQKGKLAELADRLRDFPESLFDLPGFPELSILACKLFGHPTFSNTTLEQLLLWLQGQQQWSRQAAWESTLAEVSDLLRAASADKKTPSESAALNQSRQVPALSQRKYNILIAMLELKAVDAENRHSCAQIAERAEGPLIAAEQFKRPLADLQKREIVYSRPGPDGGYWLTEKGKKYADTLQKK